MECGRLISWISLFEVRSCALLAGSNAMLHNMKLSSLGKRSYRIAGSIVVAVATIFQSCGFEMAALQERLVSSLVMLV